MRAARASTFTTSPAYLFFAAAPAALLSPAAAMAFSLAAALSAAAFSAKSLRWAAACSAFSMAACFLASALASSASALASRSASAFLSASFCEGHSAQGRLRDLYPPHAGHGTTSTACRPRTFA